MIKVHKAADGMLKQLISAGKNSLIADVPVALGGDDAGLEPHDLLDAALGACTALTVTMVAHRKQMPLTDVRVEVTRDESDSIYRLRRNIELVGDLTPDQRSYLLGIANKCPVHKALQKKFEIETELKT